MPPIKNSSEESQSLFWFLFLAGTYALIALILYIEYQSFGPRIKNNDFNDYVLGWILFIPLGLAGAALAQKLNQRLLQAASCNPVAAIANFLLLLYMLYPATWYSNPNGREVCVKDFLIFLAVQLIIFSIAKMAEPANRKWWIFLQKNIFIMAGFIFAAWVYRLTFYCYDFINSFSFSTLAACVFTMLLLYLSLSKKTGIWAAARPPLVFLNAVFFSYAAVFLFILFMVVNPHFDFDRHHYNFFLGPLADLKGGKAFLVNINSQYGIMIFYFLALFFKFLPLGFESLSLVLTFLFIVQFFCFYFIARQLFQSKLYSFLCLSALLLVNYFAMPHWMADFPSAGPARLGSAYPLLLLIILRNQYPRYKNYFYAAESAVVALSIFWSFEICVYTLPGYLGFVLYECFDKHNTPKMNWESLVKRISLSIGFCAVLLGFIYVDTYVRTHQLPHWSYYFDFVFLYKNGFGMILVPPIGGWWLILGILFTSFFIILGSLTKTRNSVLPVHFNAMVFLTFYGIMQFLYYLGRAHYTNMYHISMPSILLTAYWLYWLWKEPLPAIPTTARKVVLALALLALGVYMQAFIPRTIAKLTYAFKFMPALPQRFSDALKDHPRDDGFAKAADELMNQYSGSKKELVYFFGYKGLEVSMYTGRVNAFPYSDIGQASICPSAVERIISTEPPVSTGDCIYLSDDMNNAYYHTEPADFLSTVESSLLARIKQKYRLTLVEKRNGISVYRVVSLQPSFSKPISLHGKDHQQRG